jgi:hypothetical protein
MAWHDETVMYWSRRLTDELENGGDKAGFPNV